MTRRPLLAALLIVAVTGGVSLRGQSASQQTGQSDAQAFRFRTGVELINVTATVSDASGRFVSGLRQDDFRVYQDEELQTITHFSAERVPVSLGIALDTSGSMDGEKILAARRALDRFLYQLLGPDDEVFLYRFDSIPQLLTGWTTDKRLLSDELRRIQPHGGTAMYDAVGEAVRLAQTGKHRKKALLLISDGNDTASHLRIDALKHAIRETEVLVYAIGIDTQMTTGSRPFWGMPPSFQRGRQPPRPFPFPMPGGRTPPVAPRPPSYPPSQPSTRTYGGDERVNVAALRDITDDSGGRTEIIRNAFDLDPATASIADELSKQYYLGYAANGVKDGRWHPIRVETRNRTYVVRARRGFIATP
jgi:Ca-activated chloride channel family protein